MSRKKIPIVAIVGRANVGKSSMFNHVLGTREAIVADEAGTTRDSIYGKASIVVEEPITESTDNNPKSPNKKNYVKEIQKDFWLVDTAGLKVAEDDFEFTIQEQIAQAADTADVIIVMIEAEGSITEEDRRVAKMALKTRKPVILAVNKVDKVKNPNIDDYRKLGIKAIHLTSVSQGRGVEELFETVATYLTPATITEEDDRIKIAILGRPNVGKSHLFNTLAKKQQAVVADVAGTTRDINRTVVRYMQREIELMDTAGIRRNGKIERGVEKFSVIRTLSAIEQSDVCLLLVDANEPSVTLDQKIAGMIKDAHNGFVIVISKWDSVEDKDAFTHDKLLPRIKYDFDFVPWAPVIVTSSVTGQNVAKIFDLVLEIEATRKRTIKTTELNNWLHRITDRHPPAGLKNRQPKLRYIVQEDGMNYPSFKVFGSQLKYLHWSYRRHMERTFRETFDFHGTGIKFWFIEQHEPKKPSSRGRKKPR